MAAKCNATRPEGVIPILRVVLADDHPIILAGITALIGASPGIKLVGTAADTETALTITEALRPDVAVFDVLMPGNAGRDLIQRAKSACPDLKVLVLTVHEDRWIARELLLAGASGYLLKRSAVDELVRAIEVVAAGGTYIDPAIAGDLINGSPKPPARHRSLSERETAVLRMTARGFSAKEMAEELDLSAKTIETYRARAAEKIGARSRSEIVRYGVTQGWLKD